MKWLEDQRKESIKKQRNEIIKFIRINGYRLIFGIGAILIGSTVFLYWAGEKYNTPVLSMVMTFIGLGLVITAFLSMILVEAFVLKAKKYSDDQVSQTYKNLLNIEKNKRNK